MPLDRAKLREQIMAARASIAGNGGTSWLRFSVSAQHGWQATNNRIVSEALCALWNAAPELLEE